MKLYHYTNVNTSYSHKQSYLSVKGNEKVIQELPERQVCLSGFIKCIHVKCIRSILKLSLNVFVCTCVLPL